MVSAVAYGWIDGYSDGTFQPEKNITRAEAAKMVNAMLARQGDQAYVDAHGDSLRLFPDVAKDHWAYYEIAEAANAHDFAVKSGAESWTR